MLPRVLTPVTTRHRLLRGVSIAVLLCMGLATSGCSTIQSVSNTNEYYGGTRADLAYFGEPTLYSEPVAVYGFFDLPFSLVADTVIFPVQFVMYATTIWDGGPDPEPEGPATYTNTDDALVLSGI